MKIITPSHYPCNIAVFTADGFDEAMRRANAAMEQDNIQGAVWHDPNFVEEPFDVNKYFDPRQLRFESQNSYDVQARQKAGEDPSFRGANCIPYSKSDTGLMEKICMQGLNDIAPYIRNWGVSVFKLDKSTREPDIHLDRMGEGSHFGPTEHGLFNGKVVRLVKAWRGAGTMVINPADETQENLEILRDRGFDRFSPATLSNPWQVAVGDTLFIADTSWGKEKALLHGEPGWKEFETRDRTKSYSDPRIVQILTIM